MLNALMLSVAKLNVTTLNAIMLSVIIPSAMTPTLSRCSALKRGQISFHFLIPDGSMGPRYISEFFLVKNH
jgi:hypothetical protein